MLGKMRNVGENGQYRSVLQNRNTEIERNLWGTSQMIVTSGFTLTLFKRGHRNRFILFANLRFILN